MSSRVGNFVDWEEYLGQFYTVGSKFLYNDQKRPTLMKAHHFSFGFTDSEDTKTGSCVLIQHDRYELRTTPSFDKSAEWLSFHITTKKVKRPLKPERFVAYTEQLTLDNKQIRDLTKHRCEKKSPRDASGPYRRSLPIDHILPPDCGG